MTRYQILEHPNEHVQATKAVAHHCALFEHPPYPVTGDRDVHSADTEKKAESGGGQASSDPISRQGVEERQVLERRRNWKRGYRWRAGIEGRIASLRRDFCWRRSRYHVQDGMERWLGLGMIASNLRRIARAKLA